MGPPSLPRGQPWGQPWGSTGKVRPIFELLRLKSDAHKSAAEGQLKQAIDVLREVVSELQISLHPAHPIAADAVYDLSQFLASDNQMKEAEAVLDWVSSDMVKKEQIRGERTIQHYSKVFHLLQSWGRHEDATLLRLRLFEQWKIKDSSHAPSIPNTTTGFTMPEIFQIADLERRVSEPKDEHEALAQLEFVESLISSKLRSSQSSSVDIEGILRAVIASCSSRQLSQLNMQAHCCLAKFHKEAEQVSEAKMVLDQGLEVIEEHLTSIDDFPILLLRPLRDLAFQYQDLSCTSECEEALEMIASFLDGHAISSRPYLTIIKFAISVGFEWQRRSSWDAAEPWFERALATSITYQGCSHPQSLRLEEALEKRQYSKLVEDRPELPLDLDMW